MLLVLSSCVDTEAEPLSPPPPDPCVALRAQIEALHAARPCVEASECELAPGILAPGVEPHEAPGPPRYGLEGSVREARPCGTAIHHQSRVELDALLHQWTEDGCGPVSRPGSTACVTTSHGARATCTEGRCSMTM